MFSTVEFIEASRDFVCVRLETYERPEYQELIRKLLHGRLANTAFCILAPDGEEQLTNVSRSPTNVLGAEGRGPNATPGSAGDVIAEMKELASPYRVHGKGDEMTLQDFHSFRQALNVASGDQRLLVFVTASESDRENLKQSLKPVFADPEVIGKFHLDFGSPDKDKNWASEIARVNQRAGIFVIQADQFGQAGEVVAHLPVSANGETVKKTLLTSNEAFAAEEERKSYSDHVSKGRREGIVFETEVPYGEDRDGDGEVDRQRGGKGGKGGKGKSKGRG